MQCKSNKFTVKCYERDSFQTQSIKDYTLLLSNFVLDITFKQIH